MVARAPLILVNCSTLTQFAQLVTVLTLVRDTLLRHHSWIIFSLTPPSYLCSYEAQGRRGGESD